MHNGREDFEEEGREWGEEAGERMREGARDLNPVDALKREVAHGRASQLRDLLRDPDVREVQRPPSCI